MPKRSMSLFACASVLLASPLIAEASEPAKVVVKLEDGSNGQMALTVSPKKIPPGPVEFTIENASGSTKHEFLFVRWPRPDDKLPYDAKAQQVQEDAVKGLQGVEDLNPHESVTAQFTLSSGRYVVFCNEPGHYRSGMHADFVVGSAK
ncbi:MAG: hypothetical protein EPN57_06005 [Paraburkholderia sp.]|nr:MAG: hypothetical protein EPN57_06005 [Paraburkholderia sp.]